MSSWGFARGVLLAGPKPVNTPAFRDSTEMGKQHGLGGRSSMSAGAQGAPEAVHPPQEQLSNALLWVVVLQERAIYALSNLADLAKYKHRAVICTTKIEIKHGRLCGSALQGHTPPRVLAMSLPPSEGCWLLYQVTVRGGSAATCALARKVPKYNRGKAAGPLRIPIHSSGGITVAASLSLLLTLQGAEDY